MHKVLIADNEALRNKAFEIRKEVFVVEQEVADEEEFDEFEDISRHFVVLDDTQQPIGAARWRRTNKGIKMERFAVKATVRGQGVGSALVEAVIKDIQEKEGPGQYLYMHAQITAVDLYRKFGFTISGEQFEECAIMHYKMFKQL